MGRRHTAITQFTRPPAPLHCIPGERIVHRRVKKIPQQTALKQRRRPGDAVGSRGPAGYRDQSVFYQQRRPALRSDSESPFVPQRRGQAHGVSGHRGVAIQQAHPIEPRLPQPSRECFGVFQGPRMEVPAYRRMGAPQNFIAGLRRARFTTTITSTGSNDSIAAVRTLARHSARFRGSAAAGMITETPSPKAGAGGPPDHLAISLPSGQFAQSICTRLSTSTVPLLAKTLSIPGYATPGPILLPELRARTRTVVSGDS